MELTEDCLPMESGQLPRQICCAIKLSDKVAQLCCVSDIGLTLKHSPQIRLGNRRHCALYNFIYLLNYLNSKAPFYNTFHSSLTVM